MELICNGNTDNILEFGTNKEIIKKEKPTTFKELINIVMKSHSDNNYKLSKAHASSYVVFAYKLSWYKANYPKEFKKISSKY